MYVCIYIHMTCYSETAVVADCVCGCVCVCACVYIHMYIYKWQGTLRRYPPMRF